MLMAVNSVSLFELRLSFLSVFQPYSTLKAFQSFMAFFYRLRDTRFGRADTTMSRKITMCNIDNGVFREIDMFEVLELFEKRREDVESFFLNKKKMYAEIKAGELVASVIEDEFEVMKVFINEFVKVDFLFAFFLFLAFFLHLGFKLYNSNGFEDDDDYKGKINKFQIEN
jgi:hypothetical protein